MSFENSRASAAAVVVLVLFLVMFKKHFAEWSTGFTQRAANMSMIFFKFFKKIFRSWISLYRGSHCGREKADS